VQVAYKTAGQISDFDRICADKLAKRLTILLETALPMDPSKNEAEMTEVIQVRKELEDMGLLVSWKMESSIEDLLAVPPQVSVKVSLFTLREGVDPDTLK
jgi:hypothetical protein